MQPSQLVNDGHTSVAPESGAMVLYIPRTLTLKKTSKPRFEDTNNTQSTATGSNFLETWPYPPRRPPKVTNADSGNNTTRTPKKRDNAFPAFKTPPSRPSSSVPGFSSQPTVPTNPFPSPPKSTDNSPTNDLRGGRPVTSNTTSNALALVAKRKNENEIETSEREDIEIPAITDMALALRGEHPVKRRKNFDDEIDTNEIDTNKPESHLTHKAYLKRRIRDGNSQISILTQRSKEHVESQRALEDQLKSIKMDNNNLKEQLKSMKMNNDNLNGENNELRIQAQCASSEIQRWSNLAGAWKNRADNCDKQLNLCNDTIRALKEKEKNLLNRPFNGVGSSIELEKDLLKEKDEATKERDHWKDIVEKCQSRIAELEQRLSQEEEIKDKMIENYETQISALLARDANQPVTSLDPNGTTERDKNPNMSQPRGDKNGNGNDVSTSEGQSARREEVQSEAIKAAALQKRLRAQQRDVGNSKSTVKPSRGKDKRKPSGDNDVMMSDPETLHVDEEPRQNQQRGGDTRDREGYEEDDEGGSGSDDEYLDEARTSKPVTRKLVERIARNVVKEELGKPSKGQTPRRKNGKKTALDKEKEDISKEECNWTRELAREVMRKKFNVTSTDDFALCIPPNREVVENYATLRTPDSGPNKDMLEIDMRGKISSPWNKRVVAILVEAAEELRGTDEDYQGLPKRSSQYMEEVFKGMLERARVAFSNAQQKLKENGEVETLEEVEERMVDQKERTLKEIRVNGRRQTKYGRRLASAKELAKLAKSGTAQAKIMNFVVSVMEELGADGMSSDDSCVEDGREFFVVRKMPHRRNIEGVVKLVDDGHNSSKRLTNKRGAKLVPRIRSDRAPVTRRPPFIGRCKPVYTPHWLKAQTPEELLELRVSDRSFKWIDLDSD